MGILTLLIVGLIAGALAGRVTKGSGFGILGDIVVGLVGALIGGWVLSLFSIDTSGSILYDILVAFIRVDPCCLLQCTSHHRRDARIDRAHIIQAKMKELKLSYPTIDERQREELAKAKKILLSEKE